MPEEKVWLKKKSVYLLLDMKKQTNWESALMSRVYAVGVWAGFSLILQKEGMNNPAGLRL